MIRVFRVDASTTPATIVFDVPHPRTGQPYAIDFAASGLFSGVDLHGASTWQGACTAPNVLLFGGRETPRCSSPVATLLGSADIDVSHGSNTRTVRVDGETGRVWFPRMIRERSGRQRGFGHLETVLATFFVAVLLVPALDGLQLGLLGADVHAEGVEAHYHVVGHFETVLAEPFDDLLAAATAAGGPATPTLYSDPAGTPRQRLVFLAPADIDNADGDDDLLTGAETDALWVRIELAESPLAFDTVTVR